MGKAHRATGRPRGRPPKIPFDFSERILESLRRRVDPKTGLVKPLLSLVARELGVSRSTISRQMVGLRQCGVVEIVEVHVSPKMLDFYYRLRD